MFCCVFLEGYADCYIYGRGVGEDQGGADGVVGEEEGGDIDGGWGFGLFGFFLGCW